MCYIYIYYIKAIQKDKRVRYTDQGGFKIFPIFKLLFLKRVLAFPLGKKNLFLNLIQI